MTYQEKKDLLRSYRVAYLAAADAARRLDEFRQRNAGVKAIVYDTMPKGSPTPRDLSDYAAKLDDLVGDVWREAQKYQAQSRRVMAVIENVSDARERRLLSLRYLDFYTFEAVADTMGYSVRQVLRIHRRAIENLKP